MSAAFVGLGGNIGDRSRTLRAAIRRLRSEPGIRLLSSSALYETIPVDCPTDSPHFLNAVVAIETDREPIDLLKLLLKIERQFGRIRMQQNGPRTLDLDLLLYSDQVIQTPELVLPHPRLHERLFVLVPLLEAALALGFEPTHPILKLKPSDFIQQRNASSEALPKKYSEAIRTTDDLIGKHALVTGSSRGIGAEIATQLERRGAKVIRHGRKNLSNLEFFLSADLSDAGGPQRLASEAWAVFGELDIVVLNAGVDTLTGDSARWPFEQKLDSLLAVDLKATMLMARNLGQRMKNQGYGCITTIGWDQAETGMEGDSGELFSAVKGAIMTFTRSLALSLAPEVRVNCVAPGWIRTAWGETASAVWQNRVRLETPLQTWGLPEDVASAVCWLASPESSFITGQTIRVNGGAV